MILWCWPTACIFSLNAKNFSGGWCILRNLICGLLRPVLAFIHPFRLPFSNLNAQWSTIFHIQLIHSCYWYWLHHDKEASVFISLLVELWILYHNLTKSFKCWLRVGWLAFQPVFCDVDKERNPHSSSRWKLSDEGLSCKFDLSMDSDFHAVPCYWSFRMEYWPGWPLVLAFINNSSGYWAILLLSSPYLVHSGHWSTDAGIVNLLTLWGRVTHICVSKLTIIASDNGLSPYRRQAINWTSVGILLIGPVRTSFIEIFIKNSYIFIEENESEIVVCKIVAILSLPPCFNLLSATRTWGTHRSSGKMSDVTTFI